MMAYASIAIANDDSISSATGAAFEQTREQIGRTAQPLNAPRLRRLLDRCVALGKHLLLTLDRFPERIADDAKLGNRIPDPFGFGVEPDHILAGADRKSTRLNSSH